MDGFLLYDIESKFVAQHFENIGIIDCALEHFTAATRSERNDVFNGWKGRRRVEGGRL